MCETLIVREREPHQPASSDVIAIYHCHQIFTAVVVTNGTCQEHNSIVFPAGKRGCFIVSLYYEEFPALISSASLINFYDRRKKVKTFKSLSRLLE